MAQLVKDLVNHAASYTWTPIVAGSRRAVLTLFSRITVGQLVVTDATTNVTTVFGALEPRRENDEDLKGIAKPAEGLRAELRVQSDVFWVRLLLFADMVRSRMWREVSFCTRATAEGR